MGLAILGCQIILAILVTAFVVRRAKNELHRTLNSKNLTSNVTYSDLDPEKSDLDEGQRSNDVGQGENDDERQLKDVVISWGRNILQKKCENCATVQNQKLDFVINFLKNYRRSKMQTC